ncbi:hypothetical protein M1L60_17295 [Actinoplanes sp. TRM 88003]|uniref:Uncharacterized protein n=1 Tax=Paractinoplanes aksuensis TaxID=2939490 RepID=A0ABT1DNE3_9ACTN|nr:hypothetical protein [Actinoplanes aksuensis]MCO8272352.1 hypothetical protein [Actinoplanes aksuensis]
MPTLWGDGGDQRYVVGTRRRTGGRSLIRLVINTENLVNYRVRPVHSPSVYAAMGQPSMAGHEPRLYPSREAAQETADSWKWQRTRVPHLALNEWPRAMHNADEPCEFCDGRDAAMTGGGLDTNPHELPESEPPATIAWWGTNHGLWRAGWLTETNIKIPDRLADLALLHLALARRTQRSRADWLARTVKGKTLADLHDEGVGRDRIRFLRGDHDPRQLDGIVHAWLDTDNRVIRTKSG